MGSSFDARCKDCGEVFEVSVGGGFEFDMLHCEACGKAHPRKRDQLDVEAKDGLCSCGGTLSRDAPSRCPKCRSTQFEPIGNFTEYD